ncbi:MAG: DNA polymerase I [Spirochaetales bacterium]|jgi:DNA polymerase-1|nr:DNA polymerase I [Spirochaetales bacterium]
MKTPLYVLDGYSLIYRSYFAFIRNPLRNARGENTSALFGFYRSLFALFHEKRPEYFAIILDSKTPTFRHEMYPEYKMTRQKTPDELKAQIPLIEEIAAALGIPALRVDGVEADDIMASYAARCAEEKRPCYIISGDKDLLQMVGDEVKILRPEKGDFLEMGREEVFSSWAVYPEQIVDYLSLVGDTSDNVPGAKGIGEKTAASLLEEFHDLDTLYKKLDAVKSASWRKKLEEGRDSVYLSKKLIQLKSDVPLPPELPKLPPLNAEAAQPLFVRHSMKILADEAKKFAPSPKKGAKKSSPAGDELLFDEPSPAETENRAEGPGLAANAAAGAPPASQPPREKDAAAAPGIYETVSTAEALDAWVEKVLAAQVFAFDTETTDFDPHTASLVGFSLCVESGKACYVPVIAPFGQGMGLETALPRLKKILEAPNVKIIGQNLKFDYKIMSAKGIRFIPGFDTMLAAWLLCADSGSYSMDRLAEQYLDYKTLHYTDVVSKGETFDSVPLETATRYAAEDADITFRLYEIFSKLLAQRGLEKLFFELEMPLVRILADMELEGIGLDPAVLETYGQELEKDLNKLQNEIYQLVGREFNINSTKQLQDILFKERHLAPSKKTKTGYSTDTSVLEELAREDPVPEKILTHRTLSKLKSTYVDSLPRLINPKTGRVHTNFQQTGTATGRLSSKDPNLQNIPIKEAEGRRIRGAFIPARGKVFLSADYSQIELVILAHLSGDPGLLGAFHSGKDVHALTASLIFGVDQKDVSAEERRIAKTINFGVMYGMSAFRLSKELSIPRSDAARFIESYFARYSKIQDFIAKTVAGAEETGSVKTLLGHERPILAITSRNKTERMGAQRVAVNTPIQGSAADIVKLAMLRIDEKLEKENLSSRLILQVHDELIFEVPQTEIQRMKELVQEEMEAAYTLTAPLRVSIETGKSWGEMH